MIIYFLAAISAGVVMHPVVVHCNNVTPAAIKGVPWVGWAYVGRPYLTLRPGICKKAAKGDKGSLYVLAHELGHTQGRKTEAGADRWADAHIKQIVFQYNKLKALLL